MEQDRPANAGAVMAGRPLRRDVRADRRRITGASDSDPEFARSIRMFLDDATSTMQAAQSRYEPCIDAAASAGSVRVAPVARRTRTRRRRRARRSPPSAAQTIRGRHVSRRRRPAPPTLASMIVAAAAVWLLAVPVAATLPAAGARSGPVTPPSSTRQSMVVASDVESVSLERSSYAATTAAEVAAIVSDRQARAAASRGSCGDGLAWPLSVTVPRGEGFGERGGSHQGLDLPAPGGTGVLAAAAGTVRLSSEGHQAYGVAVMIDHMIDGCRVSTLYGHLRYGSRQVFAGQSVAEGQLIGRVGSTGRSTGDHLHLEVRMNSRSVDPALWLRTG